MGVFVTVTLPRNTVVGAAGALKRLLSLLSLLSLSLNHASIVSSSLPTDSSSCYFENTEINRQ